MFLPSLVEFAHPKDARRAIDELNESELDGRNIYLRADDMSEAQRDRDYRPRERRDCDRNRRSYSRSESESASASPSRSPPVVKKGSQKSLDHLLNKKRHGGDSRSRSRSESREAARARECSDSAEETKSKRDGKKATGLFVTILGPKRFRIIIENLPSNIKLHLLTDAFKDFGNIVNSSLEFDDDVDKDRASPVLMLLG